MIRRFGLPQSARRLSCSPAPWVIFGGHVILAWAMGPVVRIATRCEEPGQRSHVTAIARAKSTDATLATRPRLAAPLTAEERSGTIRRVRPVAASICRQHTAIQDRARPKRGSTQAGTTVLHNWDFNIAGVVYERGGKDLYSLSRAAASRSDGAGTRPRFPFL